MCDAILVTAISVIDIQQLITPVYNNLFQRHLVVVCLLVCSFGRF